MFYTLIKCGFSTNQSVLKELSIINFYKMLDGPWHTNALRFYLTFQSPSHLASSNSNQ